MSGVMQKRGKRQAPATSRSIPLKVKKRRNYGRWRALSLSLVYVVFAAHIIHWKMAGKTLAPLELNEVMYTLELGVITAGFLFMCFLVLGTAIFGRFFCSWACHIIVLQDLCAWILRKLGIRRKPIRSRLLLLVPPLTAFYMFIWPQILRSWHDKAFPKFHFRTDAEGWASFATNDFWRNLPGPWIIVFTFLVCGFVIVYLLGSRTFCTYVCPYGAIFALADRFAPGRIHVTDACVQCGTCTAVCTSGVRVHEEVKQHGMIVNSSCLKDLDCVSACPQNALHYSFGKPSLAKSRKSGGRFGSVPYDFSLAEELLIALVFVVVLFTFRGLYGAMPFFVTLALGGIIAYLSVTAARLLRRSDIRLASMRLKSKGHLEPGGYAFSVFYALLLVFIGHSAVVRYHEYFGLRQAAALDMQTDGQLRNVVAASAFGHLSLADRWGLLRNEQVERGVLTAAMQLERFDDARTYASRVLDRYPDDLNVRLQLAQSYLAENRVAQAEHQLRLLVAEEEGENVYRAATLAAAHQLLGDLLLRRGDFSGSADEFQAALELSPNQASIHADLGSVWAEMGRFEPAVTSLSEAVRLDPNLGDAHYNLGTILGHLGRFAEAVPHYEKALVISPDDAALHNNLGFSLLRLGERERSRSHLEQAIELDPNQADAHFNLANLFASKGEFGQANDHFQAAVRLDPRYAELLKRDAP